MQEATVFSSGIVHIVKFTKPVLDFGLYQLLRHSMR